MRATVPLALAGAACCAAAPATAAPRQKVTASPNPVSFGQQLTIKGKGWAVIEFCRPKVLLKLKSSQNAVSLGNVPLTGSGRFKTTFTPRRSKIGAGTWKLLARQRCESGKDGSTLFSRATIQVTIRQ